MRISQKRGTLSCGKRFNEFNSIQKKKYKKVPKEIIINTWI